MIDDMKRLHILKNPGAIIKVLLETVVLAVVSHASYFCLVTYCLVPKINTVSISMTRVKEDSYIDT